MTVTVKRQRDLIVSTHYLWDDDDEATLCGIPRSEVRTGAEIAAASNGGPHDGPGALSPATCFTCQEERRLWYAASRFGAAKRLAAAIRADRDETRRAG